MDRFADWNIADWLLAFGIDCDETVLRRVIRSASSPPRKHEIEFNDFLDLGMGESRTMNIVYKLRDAKASTVY